MANCQRPGCTNPIIKSKTRPAKYCSGACRQAHQRFRKAVLVGARVNLLIARVQAVLDAMARYDVAPTLERFRILHRRIDDLADVPLLSDKGLSALEPEGPAEVSAQTLPGVVLANATGQGGGRA